jgi:Flp pilus assembly protein TadD
LARDAPAAARVVEWIDANRLLPNAFIQGAFYSHASLKQMPAYLGGEISESGWWYYFPLAIVVKTPLALLVLVGVGLFGFVRRGRELGVGNQLFVLIPIVAYLGTAMASGVNIGLRHVLPIYPFLLLIAAAGARELLRLPRRMAVAALALVAIVWTGEFARAYPHPLTFFNQLVGGPPNGYRYLADSNLGWGQGLKGLKSWMARNGVAHVNLAYFGQADPAYYGIDCTYLPGGPSFALDKTSRPRLPGYVAISSTTLSGVYAPPPWRLFYRPFQDLKPAAVIGNSIRVYWVERWPDATGRAAGSAPAGAHRALADALLYGLQWPSQAAVHYREYLRVRAGDTDALVSHGIALIAADEVGEGVASLHRAVESNGDHGLARLMLGKALFGGRDVASAAAHAERAAELLPGDADAHHLLGRVRAARGDFAGAARAFERVVQIQPDHAEAHEYLRRVRNRAGPADRDLARAGYERR